MLETASSSLAATLPRAYDVTLLRMRMRLALLTMAILPTTLAMALAHSTLSVQTVTDHLRLQERAQAAARVLDTRLDQTAASVLLLAANPTIAGAAADPEAARTHARALLGLPPVAIERIAVIDRSGRETVLHPSSAEPAGQPDEAVARSVAALPGRHVAVATVSEPSGPRLLMTTPLVAEGGLRTGALRVQVALAGIVGAARANMGSEGELLLIDGSSAALLDYSDAEGGAGAAPEVERVIDGVVARAEGAGQWALGDGWTASSVPLANHFADWRVVLLQRIAEPELPLALLALLGALSVMLVGITVWMARQVLRPAQELASSREQLLQLYEEARGDALRDGLTGLGNHRAFQEELRRQLEWYARYKVPVALMLIDIDDLKVVNDSEGHAAGDDILRQIGRLISTSVRFSDRAFRIGGDEFAVLMPHADLEAGLAFGRRLLAQALSPSDGRRPVAFSAGVSACPTLATTGEQLYAQADVALYWCKRHGRGAVDVFDPVRDRVTQDAVGASSTHIARVIAAGLLRAVYQPIVDLASGDVIGYEGLIRPLPETGYGNPGELFAAAAAAGRTVELDHACAQKVLEQADGLAAHQMLSVNLSPRTVEAPQFSVEWLTGMCQQSGVDPRRLIVELTEHEIIEDLPRLQRNLTSLQRAGIRVAVDDVGAGNAGLRLLSQFRFDIVKVDLSLVQDGTRRDSSRAVLSSLRELAGRWGAYVVAEGLETVSQLRVVREIGLSAGQGFLLGRPAPTPALRRVDLASIEAGGVVLEVRRPVVPDQVQAPAPRPRPA